jgi:hypothetical protein
MTEPTNAQDARQARAQAENRLSAARHQREEVKTVTRSLGKMLEENHFSLRLARALGLEDDRR